MNTDQKLRDQDKRLAEQLADLRKQATSARSERDEFKGKLAEADFTGEEGKNLVDTQIFKDAMAATEKLGGIEDNISNLEQARVELLKMMGGGSDNGSRNGHGTPQTPQIDQILGDNGWNGHRLLADSGEFQEATERGIFLSEHKFGTVNVGRLCDREGFRRTILGASLGTAAAGDVGTPSSSVPQDYRGIISPYLGPLNLLDVIPTGTTDSNIINYVQVTAIPGYAAETAELAAKPAEGLTLVDATAPVRTIAGYLKVARQALADLAGLGSLINTVLPWDIRRRLQAQILAGDGTGQNLTGILNTSGIGAPASAAGDTPIEGILRAITTVVLSDADPSVVALNPNTWQTIMIAKASGSGEYLAGPPGVFFNNPTGPTIWGLRVVQNRYVPQASPIVFDPASMMLLVREGVNVRTSDSDQDDFTKNRVTLLAETRVAFPVWRPAGIAKSPLG